MFHPNPSLVVDAAFWFVASQKCRVIDSQCCYNLEMVFAKEANKTTGLRLISIPSLTNLRFVFFFFFRKPVNRLVVAWDCLLNRIAVFFLILQWSNLFVKSDSNNPEPAWTAVLPIIPIFCECRIRPADDFNMVKLSFPGVVGLDASHLSCVCFWALQRKRNCPLFSLFLIC